jgi:hypothetical protein
MIRGILLSVLLLCLPAGAQAATYYLDDAGSNANAGTSTGEPWLTWAYAFANSDCGDRLIVKNGTYTIATHGAFSLTKVCTAGTVYTVIAQNERAAFINGDGTAAGLLINASAYITVEGLRVKSADLQGGRAVSNIYVNNSNHITLRRLLVTHNNRYNNTHLLQLTNTTNSLVEENEVYFFHRHGIIIHNSNANVIRRNYCNPRNYANIAGGYDSSPSDTGDDCMLAYPGSNNIFENNIAEGNMLKGFAIEALGTAIGNKFYGNIVFGGALNGIALDARGTGLNFMPRDTVIKDFVVVEATSTGIRLFGTKNTRCDNCMAIAGKEGHGLFADVIPSVPGDGAYSIYSDNSLMLDNTGTGFLVTDQIQTWTVNSPNSFKNRLNYNPSSVANWVAEKTVDPLLGACRVWIPDNSPLKRAGKNGEDIGANILYRYKNGVLTNVPLWNPTTGEFPRGALVAGLNDVAGQSLFDVHKRLNVNRNGCSFPANYGDGVTDVDAPNTPSGLRLF